MGNPKPAHHLIKTLGVLRPEFVESGVKALLRRESLAGDAREVEKGSPHGELSAQPSSSIANVLGRS